MGNNVFINYNDLFRTGLKEMMDKYNQSLFNYDKDENFVDTDEEFMEEYDSISDFYDSYYYTLINMKNNSEKIYNDCISVMFVDTYRMLLSKLNHNLLEADKMKLFSKLRRIEDVSDIDEFIEMDPEFLADLVDGCYDFASLSDLSKKTIIKETMKDTKYLLDICPSMRSDNIIYGKYTNTDEYVNCYYEMKDKKFHKLEINNAISSYLRFLYNNDKENYDENVLDMTRVYYKTQKYVLLNDIYEKDNSALNKSINFIEKYSKNKFNDIVYEVPELLDVLVKNYIDYSLNKQVTVKKSENEVYIANEDEIDNFILNNTDLSTKQKLGISKPKTKTKDE